MDQTDAPRTVPSAEEDTRAVLLARSGLLDPAPDAEVDHWTSVLRRATGASVVAVSVQTEDGTLIRGMWAGDATEPETIEIPAGEPVERFVTARVPAESKTAPRAYLAGPVKVDGHVICTISLADAAPRDWTERDLQTLENATAAMAVQVRLRLANHDAVRFHELVASHNRVHELIAVGAPLQQVLVELVEGIERHDPSVIPCVVLLDREAGALRPGAAPSLPPHYFAAIDGVVIGPNVGSCGSAAWSGQLTIAQDIAEDPKWAPIRDFAVGAGLRHCWSMPIKDSAGDVQGTLALYGPRPRRPLPEHLTLMEDGARLAGIAIERHRAFERLVHDARHDGLSGLPNRMAIFESLDEAIVRNDSGASVAVLFVGSRRAQDAQRHAWPRPRRRDDPRGRSAPRERRPEHGLRRSLRRRRVHRGRRGDAQRGGSVQARLPPAGRDLAADVGDRVDGPHRQHRNRDDRRHAHRRPRGHPPGGQRDVRGQARGRRPDGLLPRQPPRPRGAPAGARPRAARLGAARRARARVPARVRAGDRQDRGGRGAPALEQPGPRPGLPRRADPGRRRHRHDRPDRGMGAP